jgi:hypothetical protein
LRSRWIMGGDRACRKLIARAISIAILSRIDHVRAG